MRIPVTVMIVALAFLAMSAAAENLIENADFEADEPALWTGGVIQSEVVHSGARALRVDMPEGETASSARYGDGLQLNQTEAETLLVSFWIIPHGLRGRVDAGVVRALRVPGRGVRNLGISRGSHQAARTRHRHQDLGLPQELRGLGLH
jgi:hypothetical protein